MPKINESDIVIIRKVNDGLFNVFYDNKNVISCCGIYYNGGELTKKEAVLRLLLV